MFVIFFLRSWLAWMGVEASKISVGTFETSKDQKTVCCIDKDQLIYSMFHFISSTIKLYKCIYPL